MIRRIGHLLYDSAQAGARFDARSSIGMDRALLFRAGDYSVDLMVQAGSSTLHLVQGQEIHVESGAPLVDAAIRLGENVESVWTDEHGEFALGLSARGTRTPLLSIETEREQLLCHLPLGDDVRGGS